MELDQGTVTLIAAGLAALVSFVGLFVNARMSGRNNKKEALARIAAQRFEWANAVRANASEYLGFMAQTTAEYQAEVEAIMEQRVSEEDPTEEEIQQILYQATKNFNEHHADFMRISNVKMAGVLLLLSKKDREDIEQWHDETHTMIWDGNFEDANSRLSAFVSVMSEKIDPEIVAANRELRGKSR